MQKIIGGVVAAWAGIVALAWWLADRRIPGCPYNASECAAKLEAMETRDNVLIWGLAVPLAVFVGFVALGLWRFERLNRQATSRELDRNR